MGRTDRRMARAAAERADRKVQKMMLGDAGPWHVYDPEKLRENMARAMALQSMQYGVEHRAGPQVSAVDSGWFNNHYVVLRSVVETDWGKVDHLWIQRNDRKPARNWRELQDIKQLVENGDERTAVEVFPPNGEVLDQANWTHLWVLPRGFALPFSLVSRE